MTMFAPKGLDFFLVSRYLLFIIIELYLFVFLLSQNIYKLLTYLKELRKLLKQYFSSGIVLDPTSLLKRTP